MRKIKNHKLIHILTVIFGLILFVAWATNNTQLYTTPSYTHVYEQGILERLDVEGHTIEKHVGKSDAYLFERLQSEDISAASTFNNMAEADYLVRMVLSARAELINIRLETERSNKKAFYHKSDTPAGRVLKRGWNTPSAGNQVRVVLIRDQDYEEGFFILTAYPEMR